MAAWTCHGRSIFLIYGLCKHQHHFMYQFVCFSFIKNNWLSLQTPGKARQQDMIYENMLLMRGSHPLTSLDSSEHPHSAPESSRSTPEHFVIILHGTTAYGCNKWLEIIQVLSGSWRCTLVCRGYGEYPVMGGKGFIWFLNHLLTGMHIQGDSSLSIWSMQTPCNWLWQIGPLESIGAFTGNPKTQHIYYIYHSQGPNK